MSATAAKETNVAPMKPDTVTVKLSRPLQTHKGEVSVIELKEPRAELVLRHGLPWKNVVYGQEEGEAQRFELEYNPAKMSLYIEEMSGIDRETLKEVAARDMNALFTAVLNMLQPLGN